MKFRWPNWWRQLAVRHDTMLPHLRRDQTVKFYAAKRYMVSQNTGSTNSLLLWSLLMFVMWDMGSLVYSNMEHTVACVCFLRGKIFQSSISWGSFSNIYLIIEQNIALFRIQKRNLEGKEKLWRHIFVWWMRIEALSFYSFEPSYEASFKSVDKPGTKVQLTRKIRNHSKLLLKIICMKWSGLKQ